MIGDSEGELFQGCQDISHHQQQSLWRLHLPRQSDSIKAVNMLIEGWRAIR